jgi:hypothetical protein
MNFKSHILKVIFAAILFILPDKNIFSQVGLYPEIEWERSLGGTNSDYGFEPQMTSDGGYIITGWSRSIDGEVTGNHGGTDYWVVKLDSSRNIVWQKSLGGLLDELSSTILETSDGDFIVAGYTNSRTGDVGNNYGDPDLDDWDQTYDIWVVKLDPDGLIIWEQNYGGSNNESCKSIKETSNGEFVIAGTASSYDHDVTGLHGDSDIWIIKIDTDGMLLFAKTFGGSADEYGEDIKETIDGGFIVAGSSYSNNFDLDDNYGENDVWVLKLDSIGELEWQKNLGGSSFDYANSIIQTDDGGFVMAGRSSSNDGDLTENKGAFDFWVVQLNSLGNIEWQKSLGGSHWDIAEDVIQTATGYLAVGYTMSHDGDVIGIPELAYSAYWVTQLDFSGNLLWEATYGGTESQWAQSIKILSDGYLVSGWSSSDDLDVTEGHGGADYWLVKLKPECLHSIYFADTDEDGFGNSLVDSISCNIPFGYLLDSTDCDDTNQFINPVALDICNSIDDNCNGFIDEDAIFTLYYADADGDTYGDLFNDSISCYTLIGYVSDSTDCDDTNPFINPAALDSCNSMDDNCNGLIDEDAIFTMYYADTDGDTYGDLLNDSSSCFILSGYVIDSTDCNDMDPLINPTAEESCNGADDNCDGNIDEGLTVHTLYLDADDDSYGNPLIDTVTCATGLIGYVSDSTDCDDSNPLIYPGAEETFNGLDDNCDKLIDEGLNTADITGNLFMIYPNPAENILFIDYKMTAEANIQIIDISGQIIYSNIFSKPPFEINIEKFPTGFYLVKLIVVEGEFVATFIKE